VAEVVEGSLVSYEMSLEGATVSHTR